jgi:hypothetical protein
LLLFSRNKSTFKSPFMIMFDVDIVIDSEVISVNRDISDHDATLINIKKYLVY